MIGIDEVGRGAFAGPLVVCAIRANNNINYSEIKDSKLLSPKKREQIAHNLLNICDIGYGWVSAAKIDEIGLTKALRIACIDAVEQIFTSINEQIVLDGNINYLPKYNCKTLIKADKTVKIVGAASIVAKYTRDMHMIELSKKYNNYGFESNKGYGTLKHIESIKRYGLCNEHRRLFTNNLYLY